MKYLFWALPFFVISSCSPTSLLIDHHDLVSVATIPELSVKSQVLNSQSRKQIDDQQIIQQKGVYYLDKVVVGYSDQLEGVYFDNANQSGLHF